MLNKTLIKTFLENEIKVLTDYRDAQSDEDTINIYNDQITRMSDYYNADRYFYLSINADKNTYDVRIAASINEELKTGSFIFNIDTIQTLFIQPFNPNNDNSMDELMTDLKKPTIKQQGATIIELQSASRIHRRPIQENPSQNYSNTGRNTTQGTSNNENTIVNFR